MSFVVVSHVEMPLEDSGFTDYFIDAQGRSRSEPVPKVRVVHYGPFDGEDEAREYAQTVGGTLVELVTPVVA